MMRKLKLYLDTSVINFLFADDAVDFKNITIDFFENYLQSYDVFISEIVYLEINKTVDSNKRDQLLDVVKKNRIEIFSPLNKDIELLADQYVNSGIIPEKKYEDALHIAYCTYFDFDILLSWNFRHLANINKQIKINMVNRQNGYMKELNLFNPMEVIYEK